MCRTGNRGCNVLLHSLDLFNLFEHNAKFAYFSNGSTPVITNGLNGLLFFHLKPFKSVVI